MLSLHGFEAAVVCDARELQTYEPTVEGRVARGWIATEVGKPFTIRIRQTAAGHHPQFSQNIYVDGKLCQQWLGINPDCSDISGMYPTATTFVPFHFAALHVTDNPRHAVRDDNAELGALKITIERRVETGADLDMSDKVKEPPKGSSAHERNKKRILGGQSVSTGPAKQVKRLYSVSSRPYDIKDPFPYVTFVFKYRSREYLLAADIIPRLVLPSKEKRPLGQIENGNEEEQDRKPIKRICLDEVEQTQTRIRQLKDELRNAEAALAEGLDLPPPNIKREPFPFAVGAVVDLTESDDEIDVRGRKKVDRPSNSAIDLTDD